MTITNDQIEEALADVLTYICKNPLIIVSETDIHTLVAEKLMKIRELRYDTLYPTGLTNIPNIAGNYKTMRVHKEYGHNDIPNARSDIVILNPQEILKIDDSLNLKVNKKWIIPEYIFEFGTEKTVGGKGKFEEHLNKDINKVKKSKEKGYVIHIQRNICKSKGPRLEKNINKYKHFAKVIRHALSKLDTGVSNKLRILVIIVDIGNEGKIKIFQNGEFSDRTNNVKEEIKKILK